MLRAHISASVLDMDHDGPNSKVTEKRGLDDWHRIGSSQQARLELCVGQPSLQPSCTRKAAEKKKKKAVGCVNWLYITT